MVSKKTRTNDGFADLHVHSLYSDGVFSPEEIVARAIKNGLRAVAITDHDCVDGIEKAMETAESTELEVVPGLELSAVKDETEIHILGYFIDWRDAAFLKVLQRIRESRIVRMKKMVYLLGEHGIQISIDSVLAIAGCGTVGRLHLARAMVKENVTGNIKEAFDKYIAGNRPCYVRHERLNYSDAINLIKNTGGVSVLAHPASMGLDEDIPAYVESGLVGIEVFHSRHRPGAVNKYLAVAKKYDLLVTGGSDCHGETKERKSMIGKTRVGYEVVRAMREKSKKS